MPEPSRSADPAASHSTAPLEAAFARRQLAENRTLIRVASVVALLLAAARGAEQMLLGSWTSLQLGQFAVVLAASIVLAAIACSPWFQRLYLPVAQVLLPL